MPLAVKSLPPATEPDEKIVSTADRLAQFIRTEVDRAVKDVERRKRLADAEMDKRARRASKHIISAGHRLERSLRAPPFPFAPIAIGLSIIAAACLLNRP